MQTYKMTIDSRLQVSIKSLIDEPRPIYITTPNGDILAIRFQSFGQAIYALIEPVRKEPD